jgi:hypothetical protein
MGIALVSVCGERNAWETVAQWGEPPAVNSGGPVLGDCLFQLVIGAAGTNIHSRRHWRVLGSVTDVSGRWGWWHRRMGAAVMCSVRSIVTQSVISELVNHGSPTSMAPIRSDWPLLSIPRHRRQPVELKVC